MKVKGLPKYSIEGGLCNKKGCMNICDTLASNGIWYCEKHATERTDNLIKTFKSIGGPA